MIDIISLDSNSFALTEEKRVINIQTYFKKINIWMAGLKNIRIHRHRLDWYDKSGSDCVMKTRQQGNKIVTRANKYSVQ